MQAYFRAAAFLLALVLVLVLDSAVHFQQNARIPIAPLPPHCPVLTLKASLIPAQGKRSAALG
ncbi:MAG: hypothetical protein C5B50_07925 [Verrucomicrobia bacterium]|nr:MAG: hypothetical protein C5B50_07925 [Verrucomicrobiota bacterium]